MTTTTIAQQLDLSIINDAGEREIKSFYCGDLLSFVMGRAQEGCCWFTIMSNTNVAAVAQLLDCACVVLCEGVVADDSLLAKAKEHNINIFGANKPTCDVILALGALLGGVARC